MFSLYLQTNASSCIDKKKALGVFLRLFIILNALFNINLKDHSDELDTLL